jgi:enterochelin esterase-like enzyme
VVHRSDPAHTEKTFKLLEDELKKQIVPFMDKAYSTRADRKGRALSGLSMGGRHTQLVGLTNLDMFSSFAILSAGDLETEKVSAAFLTDPAANQKVDYLLVGQGTGEVETIGKRAVALHEALQKHNIKHDYYVGGEGAHDWGTWRHLLYYRLLPNLWRSK